MPTGYSLGTTPRTTPGSVYGPAPRNMRIDVRLRGDAVQRVGFDEDDVADTNGDPDRGFIMHAGDDLSFILAEGDELWFNGTNPGGLNSSLSVLATLADGTQVV